jgi:hypothetical protein
MALFFILLQQTHLHHNLSDPRKMALFLRLPCNASISQYLGIAFEARSGDIGDTVSRPGDGPAPNQLRASPPTD